MKHQITIICFILVICLFAAGCATQIETTSSSVDSKTEESKDSYSIVVEDDVNENSSFNDSESSPETEQDVESGEVVSDSISDNVTSSESSDENSDTSSDNTDDVQPEQTVFDFDSIDELKAHFTKEGNKINADSTATLINAEYDALVKRIVSGKIDIAQLFINEKPLELRNKEGYSNITLFTSELYERPWIWYHCVYNSQDYTIKIMYLTEAEASDSKNQSASSFVSAISPNAPNVENAEKFSSYESIYEDDFQINKVTTKALFYQFKNGKTTISFIYGGALIKITGDTQSISADFANGLILS